MNYRTDTDEEESLEGATLYLALINFIVFVFTSLWGGSIISIGIKPLFYLGLSIPGLEYGNFWTPVTSIFVHSSIAHIGFNLIYLLIFGFRLEERGYNDQGIWTAYLITGIFAGLLSLPLLGENSISVGASGAVFGLLGVNVGVEHKNNDPNYKKVLFAAIIFFVLSGTAERTNIFAHLFGLLLGYLLGKSNYFFQFKD